MEFSRHLMSDEKREIKGYGWILGEDDLRNLLPDRLRTRTHSCGRTEWDPRS